MTHFTGWLLAGSIFLAVLAARQAETAEPAQKFLDGLRDRGYFDQALDYLDEMRTSQRADAAFLETIDYETGITLIDVARATRPVAERESLLNQASLRLQEFLREHPQHALASAAKTQLADVLVERGRIQAEQARSLDPAGRQLKWAMESVRALYGQAEAVFVAAEKQLDEAERNSPRFIDPKDTRKLRERDQLRRDLLQARLALARVLLETARTFPPGAPENKAKLQEAAQKYDQLYQQHHGDLAGLYARLGQARCYKELGELDRALAMFAELLEQPDEPEALALLKSQTTLLAMETTLLPAANKYREALAIYDAWRRVAHDDGPPSADALAIKYYAGEAALRYARSLSQFDKDQASLRQECLNIARQTLAEVAARPGEYQAQAKARLADPLLGIPPAQLPEPTTFAQARDRAKAALDRLALADSEIVGPPPVWTPDSPQTAALEEALRYYALAMKLRPDDLPAGEVNSIRYCLAYLHYRAGDLGKAASLGEELARDYPEHPQARQAAKIALAARAALFNDAPNDQQRRARRDQLLAIADTITRHWEGEPEAAEAWTVLIQAAVADGRLDQAGEYLQHIPAAAGQRGEAETIVGQASWTAWVDAWRLPPSARPPRPELDRLLDQARQLLTSGIGRLRQPPRDDGKPSAKWVRKVLALAQLELSLGQSDQAVLRLEGTRTSNNPMADRRNAFAGQWELAEEVYRTDLLACVASQQWEKAEAALRDLEPATAGDSPSVRQAVQAMIRSGGDIQEQLYRLRSQGRSEQLAKLQTHFDRFLWQVADRPQGNTFYSLLWVAEAYCGLGAAFDHFRSYPEADDKGSPSAGYYRSAVEAYQKLLNRCQKETSFAPQPECVVAVKIRLADCIRRLGGYEDSLDLLVGVLKEYPAMVDAQVAAAYTYQAWGQQKPGRYLLAITGSQKYREIWGWGELARRLAPVSQQRETYCEVRYNLAWCRYRLAQNAAAAAERAELFERAEDDILATRRFCPDLGGKAWYDRYQALLKIIQQAGRCKITGETHEAIFDLGGSSRLAGFRHDVFGVGQSHVVQRAPCSPAA